MSPTGQTWAPHASESVPSQGDGRDGPAAGRTGREFVVGFARTVCAGVAAGMIAGVLVGGIGGRLVMRILALTSAPEATGILTENGNRIGEITLGGTVGLILSAGLFVGTLGGLAFLALRRWIPGRGWRQGLVFGLVLLCLFGRFVIDPGNLDFLRLRPRSLSVGLFLILFPLFGLAVAPLAERLIRAFPSPLVRSPALLAYVIPVIILALVFVALIVLIVVAYVAWSIERWARGSRAWKGRIVQVMGYALVLSVCAFGLSRLLPGIARIL
jgi:hypothetical protein